MNYKIVKLASGFSGSIEIDQDEYLKIKMARNSLFEVLFIEEKFDYVTENFYEYEAEMLSLASRHMMFNDQNYFSMSRDRNLISRRLVNLLTVCRMYLDQSRHHLTNIYGKKSDVPRAVKEKASAEYERLFGYRVMEAIRDYAQHRGFPIHSIEFSSSLVETIKGNQFSHAVIPHIKVVALDEDGKFKSSVLAELKAAVATGSIDIRPLVREYVEGLGNVHKLIREQTKSDVNGWELILNDTIERFREIYGEKSVGALAVVSENTPDRWSEKLTIFEEFIQKRKALEMKNACLPNLHKCYVTSQI